MKRAGAWEQTGIGWWVRYDLEGHRLVTVAGDAPDADWFTGDPEVETVTWHYEGGRQAADLHLVAEGFELDGGTFNG